eukprot:6458042-Amphidinium_carterae.1
MSVISQNCRSKIRNMRVITQRPNGRYSARSNAFECHVCLAISDLLFMSFGAMQSPCNTNPSRADVCMKCNHDEALLRRCPSLVQ